MTEAAQFIQDLAVIMIAAALAGLLCKKVQLSPIVGYLLAGIAIGPSTPTWLGFVSDGERVKLFAELGLVFLMFGIGLTFSLRRLRQLGLPVVVAAFGTAFIVFTIARMTGGALGLDRIASVFFAGLFVSSSSAVIGKILTDSGSAHEKSSQLALGITLSEDMVAIVMITLLGSYAHFGVEGAAGRPDIVRTLGLFAGFVLVLVTLGLLIVPRVLRRLSREATAELETIFVAGLLFGLSLMVVKAGYSLALGAFLLGAIIAETPQRAHVERAFGGLRDMFGAIFFVAIGMSINLATLPDAIGPIAVTTTVAIVVRTLAATTVLLLLGFDTRTATRAGLIVTPLGEFAFIIAQLGIVGGLLPERYMAVAVGSALLTALIAPLLVKFSGRIAQAAESRRVPLLSRALEYHRQVLLALGRQRESSLMWKLCRKRFVQIGVEIALVSAVLIFAEPLIAWVVGLVGPEVFPNVGTALVCWSALGVLLLAPLIAIWRNVGALAMIFADFLSRQGPTLERGRTVMTNALQAIASLGLVLWFWNFVPAGGGIWLTLGVLALLVVLALVLWRRLVHWHSTMEVSLEATLGPGQAKSGPTLVDHYAPWGLHIGEVILPDRFAFAGKSIGELGLRTRFGCSVISVERQGFNLTNPGPGSHLFSDDRLLLLGTDEQIAAARRHLTDEHAAEQRDDTFRDLTMELVEIPAGSRAESQTLAALNWPRLLGVQVVGHERNGQRTVTPVGDLQLATGDRTLVLGTPAQVAALREWLG